MKVLLMVEREGWVAWEASWKSPPDTTQPMRQWLASGDKWACRVRGIDNVDEWAYHLSSRRWWLVEAESAEAAREVIAKFGEYFPVGSSITVPRIFASGGRS